MQEYGHKLFERFLEVEENNYCFDCGISILIIGKKPAHWASINNSIYLCLNCASNHRSFGVNISYIRSITIDTWNENQLRFMAAGGNQRLAELLDNYAISRSYAKDILYNSILLDYHRKVVSILSHLSLKVKSMAKRLQHLLDKPIVLNQLSME
jgi:ADP-ribosylation factor GTPase-activating protein 2/3